MRPSPSEIGRLGERIAERYLRRRGHRILGRRLQSAWAEVDLLTWSRGSWHCVEVKTGRRGLRFRPGMHLGWRQLARLQRAAEGFARGSGAPGQVDLIEVCLDARGQLQELLHHRDLRRVLEP